MTSTLDHVKYGTKLATSAALSFVKINLGGAVLTVIAFAAALGSLRSQCAEAVVSSGQSFGSSWDAMVTLRPLAFFFTLSVLVVSPVLFFLLGNKYIMMKTTSKLIGDKGGAVLFPALDRVLAKIKEKQPELLVKGGDKAKLKLQMLQGIKESYDGKWTKKVLSFGLKKIHLNDVDLGENMSFSEGIKSKTLSSLKHFAKPSKKFFVIVIATQWLIALLVYMKLI